MSQTTRAALRRPSVLADLFPAIPLRDVVLVVSAAGLVGLCAQISVPLPWTPVPMTLQTFGVLLAGATLGLWRGAAAMSLYALAGGLGLPWFTSRHRTHPGLLWGYILGFILAGAVCGFLAERRGDRRLIPAVLTMALSDVCIYLVGVPWLAASLHVSLLKAFDLGMSPFLGGDALKVVVAAGLLPGAWHLLRPRS